MNDLDKCLKCFDNSGENCPKIIVYHYTKIDDWRSIQKGSYKTKYIPGLGASRRLGQVYREAFNTCATFALQEPIPDSWVKNEEFKITWDVLVSIIGEVLLEVEVYPSKDKAYVIDYGHMDGYQYGDKTGISNKYLHKTQKDAETAYMKSMIPMGEYLLKKNQMNYSLPMVVLLEDTPIDRVKISRNQPLLEKRLNEDKNNTYFYNNLVEKLKRVPELNEWYDTKYIKENMVAERSL